jgi:aminoglycoside phosphotransferase (APT) family kinase protein
MTDPNDWLRLVAIAHESGANTWSENDVLVRRVTGGNNNALYQIVVGQENYACKLCVRDFRRRADQEYGTLSLLQTAGLDLAPQPICLDDGCAYVPYPAVVYRWLAGTPLSPPLTQSQLAAILDSIQQLHTLHPGNFQTDLADSWFHWFDWDLYIQEMHTLFETYRLWLTASQPDGKALGDRLVRLIEACGQVVRSTKVSPAREHVIRCLCRVDPNLANSVWATDGRLRWVDWEYSGWGDPALDLVELCWHAALSQLSPEQQRWLRENYRRPADDTEFDERVFVWDHIIATRWCFLILRHLWSQYNGPDRVRLTQQPVDTENVRTRLVRFIERAEQLVHSGRSL